MHNPIPKEKRIFVRSICEYCKTLAVAIPIRTKEGKVHLICEKCFDKTKSKVEKIEPSKVSYAEETVKSKKAPKPIKRWSKN